MIKKNIQYCSLAGLGRMTALLAQGQCGFDSVVDDGVVGSGRTTALQAWGQRGSTTSWARGGQCCCGLSYGVAGLGTAPAWLTASPARVREDGGT
jgi:hypothetical protein